ncbi:MAG: hypothetical protein IKB02_05970 [Clostridia bacterium]|nr:hypothetical protein [Clostridia bacterium]MBR2388299.1 hypothetical protein [Clostridia bacterium]
MAVNKVVYGGKTVIDLTNDTVSPSDLMSGVTAHGANGQTITGTFSLATEISAQDTLIAQIKSALEGKASGGGGGGASYEFSSVDFDNGGDWISVHFANTSPNGEIILQVVDNNLGAGSGFEINHVIKGTNIWVDTADTYDWVCSGATLEERRENTASGVVRWSFKITDSVATIFG